MGTYSENDIPVFAEKAAENFNAACLCISNKFINAAATRFYYALIHLAVRNALTNGVSEDLFIVEGKINKSKIDYNAKKMVCSQLNRQTFVSVYQLMRVAREKADYLGQHVPLGEINHLVETMQNLLHSEGITL